jgi:hypothetical protein
MDHHVFCDYFRPEVNPKFGLIVPKLSLLSGFMEVRARLLPNHPRLPLGTPTTILEFTSTVNISIYTLRVGLISGTKLRVFTETGIYDRQINSTINLESHRTRKLSN